MKRQKYPIQPRIYHSTEENIRLNTYNIREVLLKRKFSRTKCAKLARTLHFNRNILFQSKCQRLIQSIDARCDRMAIATVKTQDLTISTACRSHKTQLESDRMLAWQRWLYRCIYNVDVSVDSTCLRKNYDPEQNLSGPSKYQIAVCTSR